MDGSVTPHKGGAALPQGGPKVRISPKLRAAIKLRVEKGLTISQACAAAGVSEAGWYKAMLRPAVQNEYEMIELALIQASERRFKGYRARAVEVAAELMERAQSEQVRMRAVEFFRGETKQALVNVHVGAPQEPATGYRYARPTDHASDVVDAQVIDEPTQSPNVDDEGQSTPE